jgi:hypothetical protein
MKPDALKRADKSAGNSGKQGLRKPYSKPELRRLGKLSEISKKGIRTGGELIVLLRS